MKNNEKHACDADQFEHNGVLEACFENEDGTFIVDINGEYTDVVNFCPFCGKKAPVQEPKVRS